MMKNKKGFSGPKKGTGKSKPSAFGGGKERGDKRESGKEKKLFGPKREGFKSSRGEEKETREFAGYRKKPASRRSTTDKESSFKGKDSRTERTGGFKKDGRFKSESPRKAGAFKSYGKDSDTEKAAGTKSRNKYSDDFSWEEKPKRSERTERKPFGERKSGSTKTNRFKSDSPRKSGSFKSFGKDSDGVKAPRSGSRNKYSDDFSSAEKPDRSERTERKPFSERTSGGTKSDRFKSDAPRKSGSYKSYRKDSDREKTGGEYSRDKEKTERKPFGARKSDSTKSERFKEDTPRKSGSFKAFRKDSDKEKGPKEDSWDDFSEKSVSREDKPARKERRDYSRPASKEDRPGKISAKKGRTDDGFDGVEQTGTVRLNKFISNAGICSRREADMLISTGVITVNGKIVTELGYKIKPTDIVHYGGESIRREKNVYLVLNKPKDYLTTMDDPDQRKTVYDLIRNACNERVYPVGRLDRASTGVLLFTNDGDLTKKLTHPKYEKKKIYHVVLDKPLKRADMDKIAEGVTLEDGDVKADEIHYVAGAASKKEVGIELHSGKNRIIRRIFESLEYKVMKLDRVYFAGITKKDLPRGRWRFLTEKEIAMLKMGRD